MGLTGIGTAHTSATAAANPLGTIASAHGHSGHAAPSNGGPGASIMVVKGGLFTVTAVNDQTITATSSGIGFASAVIVGGGSAAGPGGIGGPGGSVADPGIMVGPGLASTSPVTVTITVSASTVYTRAGHVSGLSDVQVGSVLQVQGTNTGASSLSATSIDIVLPVRLGVVTAISGTTLTVTGVDARTYTIVIDSSTTYHRAGQTATLSAITVGSLISAEGTLSSQGSTLNALAVTIELPRVTGQVTAVSGNTVSVKGPDGTTSTVQLSDTTTYNAGPQTSADKSSITIGSFIMAEGTLGSDGSLSALLVDIATVRTFNGSTSASITVSGGDAISKYRPFVTTGSFAGLPAAQTACR